MFTRKLVIANEWIRLSDIPDSVSISFRGVLEITESAGVPDASTPLLRLENEMAPITVDSLSRCGCLSIVRKTLPFISINNINVEWFWPYFCQC